MGSPLPACWMHTPIAYCCPLPILRMPWATTPGVCVGSCTARSF
ncbi:glycosyltransferase [Xanthomonas oryzae pv. oryzae PXO99A]|uniref:Glycosyltransferase n=1 Tax=Xanthomonas oryzae pv. oryzae (strain PXO99A) TaxID=360094 RepID=A0A0K0GLA5_XANOP|nr:glycosyltransferase [Xanthomonas oryzae pv. oryzae PXO99A]